MREIRGETRATLINTQLCRKLLAQPCCSMMQCKASMFDSVRMPMLRLKLFEGLARRRLRFHDTCLPDARVTLMPTCKKKIWIDIEEWERKTQRETCLQAGSSYKSPFTCIRNLVKPFFAVIALNPSRGKRSQHSPTWRNFQFWADKGDHKALDDDVILTRR